MRPDRIIRLYCLAGDIHSAVIYTRLHNTFSYVILQLQEKHPSIADKMREEWAEYLVDCEDYLQAIDVIWPLNNEISRNKAKHWLALAYQAGGELSLRSLVKSVFLLPDTFHLYQANIKKVCNDPLATIQRAILAREVLALPNQTKLTEQLINQLIRPIIVDQYGANSVLERKEISQLIHRSTNKLFNSEPKERWSYVLPERRLTQRESLPHHLNEGLKYDLMSHSYYGVKHDKCVLTSANSHYTQRLQLPNTQSVEEQLSFYLIKRTATLVYWQEKQLTIFRLYNNQNHCTFELKWPTDLTPQYRSEFNQWYFFDKTGRLVHLNWNNGRINTLSLLLK